jgi:hypothetical protein
MTNMRNYAGSKFLKLEDLFDAGSITSTIEHVEVNKKYEKPVITLRTGAKLSLNKINTGYLCDKLGDDSDAWLGAEVTLVAGRGRSPSGVDVDMIRVTVGKNLETEPKPTKSGGGGAAMDDEIPFAPNRD